MLPHATLAGLAQAQEASVIHFAVANFHAPDVMFTPLKQLAYSLDVREGLFTSHSICECFEKLLHRCFGQP